MFAECAKAKKAKAGGMSVLYSPVNRYRYGIYEDTEKESFRIKQDQNMLEY
jgi:hypothetical protein